MSLLSTRVRAIVAVAIPIAMLASCSMDSNTTPTEPPPPPPSSVKWSNPQSWPSNAIPVANDAVVVPAGVTMLLDITPPALRSLSS